MHGGCRRPVKGEGEVDGLASVSGRGKLRELRLAVVVMVMVVGIVCVSVSVCVGVCVSVCVSVSDGGRECSC